jgi:hypothetical protein
MVGVPNINARKPAPAKRNADKEWIALFQKDILTAENAEEARRTRENYIRIKQRTLIALFRCT